MTFLTLGKRAEEFADLVDAVVTGGARSPHPRPSSEPLLAVIGALRSAPVPVPRPDFTGALRERLLAEAATLLTPAPPTPEPTRVPPYVPPRRPRTHGKIVVAATALVTVGGTAGVATAAQGALPGDTLYPVKRVIEGAELKLSTSDSGRGHGLLEQASRRLDEVEGLLPEAEGSDVVSERLRATVESFSEQAAQGSGLLVDAFLEDRDREHLDDIRSFADRSMGSLDGLAGEAPQHLVPDLRAAARTVSDIDARAVLECQCGGTALVIPADFGRTPTSAGTGDQAQGPLRRRDGMISADEFLSGRWGGRGWAPHGGQGAAAPAGAPFPADGLPPDAGTPADAPTPVDGATNGAPGLPADGGTAGPTEGPTGLPSDPATDPATDHPSDTPPEDPSEHPSPDPSDEPSEQPTDEPSGPSTDDGDPGDGGKTGGGDPQDPSPGGSTADPTDTGGGGSPGPGGGGSDGPSDGPTDAITAG